MIVRETEDPQPISVRTLEHLSSRKYLNGRVEPYWQSIRLSDLTIRIWQRKLLNVGLIVLIEDKAVRRLDFQDRLRMYQPSIFNCEKCSKPLCGYIATSMNTSICMRCFNNKKESE